MASAAHPPVAPVPTAVALRTPPAYLNDAPSFLRKLWQMLTDQTNAHVIEWHADGAMFEVKSPKQMGSPG